MVKCIIHLADIHIRNSEGVAEIAEILDGVVKQCSQIASQYEKDEIRIVISGDLLHSKNTITPTLVTYTSMFLRQLADIAKVILISGNHDTVVSNTDRIDAISSIVQSSMIEGLDFLDMTCEYNSGIVIDDNITWALYSIYDGYLKPDIETARKEYPENTVVGLFHGDIVGSVPPSGVVMEDGLDRSAFSECDCVMAGHIHKKQEIKCGDCMLVYAGSIFQNTYGETVTQHGFYKWDIPSLEHEFIAVENEYPLYDFRISKIDDIDADKEVLINF